jgi:hypothetical protein
MMAMQAVGATIAGLLAQQLPTGSAMALMGVLSLLVSLALTRGLRLSAPRPATVNDVPDRVARG